MEKIESSNLKDKIEQKDIMSDLIEALHKFQESPESVLSLNEDWIQVANMMKQYGHVRESILV